MASDQRKHPKNNEVSPAQPRADAEDESFIAELRRDFYPTKVFRRNASPKELIRCLDQIGRWDRVHSRKQIHSQPLQYILYAVAGLFCFVGVILFQSIALLVAGVLAGAMAIVTTFFYQWNYRGNVEDRRYGVPKKLVEFLGVDVAPNHPVSLEVDFRHYREGNFRKQKKSGFFSSVSQSVFEVPWLKMSGQLCDGTKFRLSAVQVVKRKEKRKRKCTKTREVFRDKYSLVIIPRPNRFAAISQLPQKMKSGRAPEGLIINHVKVVKGRVHVAAMAYPVVVSGIGKTTQDPYPSIDPFPILQLFVICYHNLGECRAA